MENWLAIGEMQIFAGVQGMGKTTIAIQLTAQITRGRNFMGLPTEQGNCVYWTGEDSTEASIIPRLMACEADMTKGHQIRNVNENGDLRPFDIATDVPMLCERLQQLENVKLLVIDPVIGIVGNAQDQYKPTVVRKALQPLLKLAKDREMAILGVTHLAKLQSSGNAGMVDRVLGSGVWTQMPRGVWGADWSEKHKARVLSVIKSNLKVGEHAYKFAIEAGMVDINGKEKSAAIAAFDIKNLEEHHDDIFGGTKAQANTNATRDAAKEFILEQLYDSANKWKTIEERGIEKNHAKRTLERARNELEKAVDIKRDGEGRSTIWCIPPDDDDEEEHPF